MGSGIFVKGYSRTGPRLFPCREHMLGLTQPGLGKHRNEPQKYLSGGKRAEPSLVQCSNCEGASGVFEKVLHKA